MVASLFDVSLPPDFAARYNIAPRTNGLILSGPDAEAAMASWWLIPPWWSKSLQEVPTAFNARAETAHKKPLFRDALPCLVPATGWREFKGQAGNKRPYRFHGSAPFCFAGLSSTWQNKATRTSHQTYAILTTEPTDAARVVHDRMPLVVPRALQAQWLAGEISARELAIAARETLETFRFYECDPFGNSVHATGPQCIAPKKQTSLF